jgi:hypothetical protein
VEGRDGKKGRRRVGERRGKEGRGKGTMVKDAAPMSLTD